ncbi:reverse transcriptase [Tanacetum coccineum]|uniref:Reverse transcriptase n=1 Tax=Tanacetum coccineum TaxID=301880 RepID=A0ABQ4XJE0_9ASTR
MVVSTRNASISSNGSPLVLDDETKRFLAETIVGMVKSSLAIMQRSMREMANNIAALSMQNQQMGNRGPQLNHSRLAKIEFPKFSGDDVKRWVFRCDQFFLMEQTPEMDKVTLISIHLYDKALLWHNQFVRIHGNNVSWEVYKQAVMTRFGNVYDDPMFELKNLKYETAAGEYEDAFDNLLSIVEVSEDHAVSLFMGGLPTNIEMRVRMFKPKTLADAYFLTNLQEATLNVVKKKSKSTFTPSNSRYNNSSSSTFKPLLTTPNTISGTVNAKPNTLVAVVNYILLLPEVENEGGEFLEEDAILVDTGLMDLHAPLISLNALTGTTNFKTMRVIGTTDKHTINILIDCGSTHNFLDKNMAKKLCYHIRSTCPLPVTVADGNNLITNSEYYEKSVRQTELHSMAICVFPNPATICMQIEEATSTPIHPMIQQVIAAYKDVFDIPNKLPLRRDRDHKIPLVEGAQLVNIRPYKHPPTKKDAIEGMVAELLKAGVIKESNGPFSSPIVMVKEKDNLWRMCVDYKQLNKQTIKDKFPIPIIDELIDELYGSQLFAKLGLSQTLKDHVFHLRTVLEIMSHHKLYAQRSKCVFSTNKVEYFGHVVSSMGVATDPEKVTIEGSFKAQTSALVLRLPNFSKEFTLETDASRVGLGAVLLQEGHLIAFLRVENVTADALSRLKSSSELFSMISSSLTTVIYKRIVDSWHTYLKLKELIKKLKQGQAVKGSYTWDNQVRKKRKTCGGKWSTFEG